jgi:microcin C transport system substrate-binding protein
LPGPQELSILEPWRNQIAPAALNAMFAPPRTDGAGSLRDNLRRARDLLGQAGWTVQDGVLRNQKGEAMVIEYLDSNEGGARVVAPWARSLEKLGIKLNYRAVDFALYQQRLSKFEFDIISLAYGGTHSPGQEYADMFGSKAALTEDSGNMAGVSSPAVDAIIARMTSAKTKADLLPACRALDRVISHSHYLIPQWTATTHRMAFNDRRLGRPALVPPYSSGEGWVINTWWAR